MFSLSRLRCWKGVCGLLRSVDELVGRENAVGRRTPRLAPSKIPWLMAVASRLS